jgi:hypothetical protein
MHMFINLNLIWSLLFHATLYVFAFHTAIDQKDIQEVQNDFCKFLMQEVLCMGHIPSLRLFALQPNDPSIRFCHEAQCYL